MGLVFVLSFVQRQEINPNVIDEEEIQMSRAARRNDREKLVKELLFVVFTFVISLVIAFFVCETVVSQSDGKVTVDEESFPLLEETYVEEIKEFLKELGYENSGVNLTMVTDGEGNRSYQVKLHHKRISSLSEEEREMLFATIEDMAFQVAGCGFEISLL